MNGHPFSLAGRVALVTGASRGLGAGMALGLAAAGADIVLHASAPPTNTAEAVERLGRRAAVLAADLSDPSAPAGLAAHALAVYGRLDILINNAGIIRRQPADAHSDEFWDAVIEVNLSSVFRLSRAVGRHMLERGSGYIINTGSVAGLIALTGEGAPYIASKFAVVGLSEALALYARPKGIGVSVLCPGSVESNLHETERVVRSRRRRCRRPSRRNGVDPHSSLPARVALGGDRPRADRVAASLRPAIPRGRVAHTHRPL